VTDVGVFSVPVAGAEAITAPMWTFSIADLQTGIVLADLPFDGISYSTPLNDSGTFGASIMLDDKIARLHDVRDLTTPGRRCFYAFRDGVPMYGGIIWTSTYASSSQTVQIGGADWWSYFDARKVLPSLAALNPALTTEVATLITDFDNIDQNEIARQLVSLAQSHTGGDIGVQLDTSFSGYFHDRTYYGYDLADVGEALRQLCNIIDGPDMRFIVAADPAAPSGVARRLVIGEPWLGQQGSQHVWEYGRNLTDYSWPRNGASMATRAFGIGEGMEEGLKIGWHEDQTPYAQGWPLLELETSHTTVRIDATLVEKAEADQASKRNPIALPTLTLRPGVAPHLGEYNTGDDARLIVKDRYWGGDGYFPGLGLDTTIRVVDTQVSYSASAGEAVEIVCAPLVEGVV
jgi:hypothetical protein